MSIKIDNYFTLPSCASALKVFLFSGSDDLTSWVNYYRNMSRLYRSMVKEMDSEITAYRMQIKNLRAEVATRMVGINEKKAALLKLAEINEVDRSNLNKAFCRDNFQVSSFFRDEARNKRIRKLSRDLKITSQEKQKAN